jgi:C4-dicarboxylate-specific signal transduction histidine kinase
MLMSELTHSNRVATAGQLAASIAHDIRQPLAAITASASAGLNWLKSRTPDIEEVRLLLKTIVTEGHRADDIITNIRSTLRKETTPQAPININDILKQVIPLAGRKMDAAGIVLRAIFAEHPSPIVFADPVQLQQVTLNLMMNAIEAMNSSTQLLRELGLKTHVDQDAVVLVVEDTGPGISPADMEKIFTPFFTTKAAGMGMGLAICKSIVEAHGGRLSVRGADYGGARFEMTLPYYRGRQ